LHDDDQVLASAQQIRPEARVVKMAIKPGEFFIFSGRTWHASYDVGPEERTAVIYQYCSPASRVRIPLNFEPHRAQFLRAQPTVMLAAGKDEFGLNHLRLPEQLYAGKLWGTKRSEIGRSPIAATPLSLSRPPIR
jgi:hypothetical protein